METRYFKYIEVVASRGSFSAAARELGLTQPMLTKLVQRMEDELGASLFERQARGVRLTIYGQKFLETIRGIDNSLTGLSNEIEAIRSGITGTVTLGAGQWWVDSVLPAALNRLSREHPDISIQVVCGEHLALVKQLYNGQLDFVLKSIPGPDETWMEQRILANVVVKPMVRPAHPLAGQDREVPLRELNRLRWVLPPRQDPGYRYLAGVFRAAGLSPPSNVIFCASFHLMMGLINEDDIIGYFPQRTICALGNSFVPIEGTACDLNRKIGIATVRHKSLSHATKLVIRAVEDALRQREPA